MNEQQLKDFDAMRAQVAALLEESTVQKQLLAVEAEKIRIEKEIFDAERRAAKEAVDAERLRLEEEKEAFAKEKEAEKRKKEGEERMLERERKKKEREANEKRWKKERKEKEERRRREDEEERKREESEGKNGKVEKRSAASFEWDGGDGDSDDDLSDLNFHFEGRTLPPGMFEMALGARRHQDTAAKMNLVVAHTMTARKYTAKLRKDGELPVSHIITLVRRNCLTLRSKFYLAPFFLSFIRVIFD